jgi:hypothetical protein
MAPLDTFEGIAGVQNGVSRTAFGTIPHAFGIILDGKSSIEAHIVIKLGFTYTNCRGCLRACEYQKWVASLIYHILRLMVACEYGVVI